MRQLCLKLRPILGPKVDQIYQAYFAEDPEGRSQIEHYLELLIAKHLPQKLGQGETELIPPAAEQATGEYRIRSGAILSGKHLYPFGLRESEWIQHMAIRGT